MTTLDDVVQAREPLAAPGESMHLVRVLRTIADTAAETLELQEVFDRVAASIRELIPFDQLEVVRILDGHTAVVHASTVPCEEDGRSGGVCSEPAPLTAWSPRVRPRPGDIRRVDDASELDAAFPIDAMILARGVRSAMWEPFRSLDVFTGGLWLSSNQPFAFDDVHQDVLAPIAALLGSTVEHWRIWDDDRRRQERLDQLETLLPTLAESLDVREVFQRVSNALQPVLPHDGLVLVRHDEGVCRHRGIGGRRSRPASRAVQAPRSRAARTPPSSSRS